MISTNQSERHTLFPPRQVLVSQYESKALQLAARSLQLKNSLVNRYENRVFNIASSAKLTQEQRKAVRKDQKSYIEMLTHNHYKKFPSQLFLTEQELKLRIKQRKEKDFEERGKETKTKKPINKTEDKKQKKQQLNQNQAVILNKQGSEQSDQELHDLGDMSDLDDGAEDDGYEQVQDDGNYEDQM